MFNGGARLKPEFREIFNKTLDLNFPERIGFLNAFDVRDENSELYKCIVNK